MSQARNFADLLASGTVLSDTKLPTITSNKLDDNAIHGNRNLIINGAMQVYQRGSQAGIRNSYAVDRFKAGGNGSQLLTYSQSTTVPSGEGFSYSAKLDVTTADTSVAAGDYQVLRYIFEGQDLQHLKYGTSDAQSLTLQFWVKSPKTGTHIVELEHADANYQNSQSYTIAAADTWQKVTLTFDGYQTTSITNDNTYGLQINWWLMAGSTFSSGTLSSNTWHNTTANRAVGQVNVVDSTSNEFYITGVQLEVGEATPFEHRSYGDELRRCQRYYYQTEVDVFLDTVGSAYNSLSTAQYAHHFHLPIPVSMRASPTATLTKLVVGWPHTNVIPNYSVTSATKEFLGFRNGNGGYSTGGDLYVQYTVDAEL